MDDKPRRLYDLVVIGASAGGIEALSVLVATLPRGLPVPIVIAQHLDPNVASHLGQILARRSILPVRTVGRDAPEHMEDGTIFVVPPDRDVEIADHNVRL
jgi:chemotaxis response regulator CheB